MKTLDNMAYSVREIGRFIRYNGLSLTFLLLSILIGITIGAIPFVKNTLIFPLLGAQFPLLMYLFAKVITG